jgi:hypothetical protein
MKKTVYQQAKTELRKSAKEFKKQFLNDKPALRMVINDTADFLSKNYSLIVKMYHVRNGIIAYKLLGGGVQIENEYGNYQLYIGYSIKDAIAKYRQEFPAYKTKKQFKQ